MTTKRVAILSAFILLFAIHCLSFAQEQTFSISKSLDLYNRDPCAAVNTMTGDVLVVWFRYDEDNLTDSKIYAALCKLQGDGSFKVGKAKLISGKNDTCSDPFVAFSTASNSFLVVWRIDSKDSGLKYIDTQVRAVNTKGKAVGKIVTLLSTNSRFEYQSVLAAVPQSVRDAVPKSVFLMSWQLAPQKLDEFASYGGLWTVMLDEKGKTVSTPKRVMKMDFNLNNFDFGETTPLRILTTEKVPFYITMVNVKLSGGERIQESYVVKLDKKGGYAGKVLLDTGNTPQDTTIALLSKKRILTSWYSFDENKCYNQLLKSTLKKSKGSYSPVSGATSSTSALAGLADGGAFQIITSLPGFYTARFNSKGKMLGSSVHHSSISYLPGDYMAVEIPGMNKVLLVWRMIKGGNRSEIAGTIFGID